MKRYVYSDKSGMKSEWMPPKNWSGTLPEGVTEHPADHPFFKPLPAGHMLDHSTLPPSVVPIPDKTPEEREAERLASRKTYSPKQFIERFTQEEINNFKVLSESNPNVWTWLMVLTGADYVDLLDPLVKDAMAWFVYEGHITQARHDEIMTLEFEQ